MSYFFKRAFLLLFVLVCSYSYSQFGGTSRFNEDYNTWAIGAGVSNTILRGDLTSFGTASGDVYINPGFYIYADRMFNPVIGLEAKINFSTLGGEEQTVTRLPGEDAGFYNILYASAYDEDLRYIEGSSFGFETNLILNLDNLWMSNSIKWNWSAYVGLGFQSYDSRLIIKDYDYESRNSSDPENDFHVSNVDKDGTIRGANYGAPDNTSSLYFNSGVGVKYRLNDKLDIETRLVFNMNSEDHLDAAISRIQNYEAFYSVNIGVVYKLGSKEKFAIWHHDKPTSRSSSYRSSGSSPARNSSQVAVVPVDLDAPIVEADSDGDGVIDRKDKCPNNSGVASNEGCPESNAEGVDLADKLGALCSRLKFSRSEGHILKSSNLLILEKVGSVLNQDKSINARIEIHTNNKPNLKYNLDLSKRRAFAIKKYLTQQSGVDSDRIDVEGLGGTKPKYDIENKIENSKNNRVEIIVN